MDPAEELYSKMYNLLKEAGGELLKGIAEDDADAQADDGPLAEDEERHYIHIHFMHATAKVLLTYPSLVLAIMAEAEKTLLQELHEIVAEETLVPPDGGLTPGEEDTNA